MARNLTEKQQNFLDVLFEEAGGNLVKARKLAGYADGVATKAIAESLSRRNCRPYKEVYFFVSSKSCILNV
jgi:hypothetical protein